MVGYGASSDAYHITSPAPSGEGGARAMINAIKDANISSDDLTYITNNIIGINLIDHMTSSNGLSWFTNSSKSIDSIQ